MQQNSQQHGYRELKKKVPLLLDNPDIDQVLPELMQYPAHKLLGALYAALLSPRKLIKWHAVTAVGATVSRLAEADLEQARIVMRHFMWTLNDESGGIGWGSPECMGEIMARHQGLAREYSRILFSYLAQGDTGSDNFLEYLPLRRGAFWGVARLSQGDPVLSREGTPQIQKALKQESDPEILGLICLYLRLSRRSKDELPRPDPGNSTLEIYWDQKLQSTPARELCLE